MWSYLFFLMVGAILLSFPLGRSFLIMVFWWFADMVLNSDEGRSLRYDFENDGPHYDYHTTELHAVKQNGGMYDDKR